MFDLFHLTHKHSGGDGAQIDHGGLYGLADDDHTQYHNNTRGDARYAPIAKGVTNGDSHNHSGGDGGQINHTTLSNIGTNTHAQIDTYINADSYRFVPLLTPLTSTSWDGDAHSTTAKTLIDLSSVFDAPAGIKAVLIKVSCRDSGSLAGTTLFFSVSPNNTAGQSPITVRPNGLPDDSIADDCGICPCNANGDIYYQIGASGSGTMDCYLQIWGYWT